MNYDKTFYKICECDVIRKYPDIQLSNTAKIVYVIKCGLQLAEFEKFITEAIRQEFDILVCREVENIDALKIEVRRCKKGLFHILYEPETGEIDLYTTQYLPEDKVWPVFDIQLLLFIRSKGDGMDVIFESEIAHMKYDMKDVSSAKVFIQKLQENLLNPFAFL